MIQWNNLQKLLTGYREKTKLSEKTGISTGNISDWFNPSKPAQPSADALFKIAKYFDCSVDYLMDRTNIKELNSNPQFIFRFPIYEQQAAAGAGITGRDGKFTMQNILTDDIPKNAVFGVHIKGESMINTDSSLIIEDIPDNSIVLLNPKVSDSDLNKTIVVASINNEVICKYFLIEQDCVHFYSLNRKEHSNDDKFAKSPDEYRIIGQVVKVIKPNEHE